MLRNRGSLPDGYKSRLSYDTARQIAFHGSETAYAKALGVNKSTVNCWRNGRLDREINGDSLKRLARYRNETPEETRTWLHGKNPKQVELIEEINKITKLDELIEVFQVSYKLIQQRIGSGELPLLQSNSDSCTLSLSTAKENNQGEQMTGDFELIRIGSRRHFKLRAILLESIRLKQMNPGNPEEIVLAMGYRPKKRRYKSALNMINSLLFISEEKINELVDFHVEALARFCHRLIRWDSDSPFKAICDTELTYEGSIEQLLADVACCVAS